MHRIRWTSLDRPHLHWGRTFYRAGTGFPTHSHDFAEFFLVEAGHGQQMADGTRVALQPGDLVFVHPDVEHSSTAAVDDSLVYVNIAIPAELHARLHAEFFGGDEDWPWNRAAARAPLALHALDRKALLDWVEELERSEADALCAQTLVCDVLRRVQRRRSDDRLQVAPDWLRDALRVFDDPRHYLGGVQGLAELAGVGREHLSRSVRRHLGCTATELVNDLRLEYAKKQLLFTNRPVQDIHLDCGYGNLSHFHRVFRTRFGTTPKQYREQHRRQVM